ncbi:MAG: hypothetical protein A2X25_13415 [Chloroflexi bacterium GWB2_49_20]|nr:MAG: hypothetical protein A2X25_13415 [Chloroflexi bacterium GWB2_49_20]OGN80015.1 MAG: hypothetical protein A2X26_03335 [Chloroflexi bacterium GWC2_49_37]OGN85449.1 MAG: hypothetical protein A2X27_03725 [Chloroflexi bacterium GWD2_49_16]HBG74313.1 hypothetical protein [Anaerolineae bacterium]HCM97077.1 hypothetical protein [Anaerolineae bacterium]
MRKFTGSSWLLPALMIILFFGWATTGVMIYIRLLFLISLLLFGSYLWNLIALNGIRIDRRSRSLRTSVGKVFDERFNILNTSRWACMWLEIENLSTMPQKSGSRLLTGLGGMQQRSYTARTWVTKRGAYPLGPTLLTTGDPFGIFVRTRYEPSKNTLIVLPMTVDIPYFPAPEGILPGGKEIHQKTMDVTPNATGIREYIPGDPIKRVHWPSTAKRDHFMVKVHEQDPQAEVWFFLDSQMNIQFSRLGSSSEIKEDDFIISRRAQIKLPEDTYEYAISATASLVKYFLQQKRAVGLVSSGSKFTVIPAERGERQIGKILETLAFLKADGDLPLLGCISMQARYLPMGSGGILVTSSVNKNLLIAVEDLTRRNLHPMVVLIMSSTFGGPSGGEELIEGLERRNVPVFKIVCGENLEKQLGQLPVIYKRTWSSI